MIDHESNIVTLAGEFDNSRQMARRGTDIKRQIMSAEAFHAFDE